MASDRENPVLETKRRIAELERLASTPSARWHKQIEERRNLYNGQHYVGQPPAPGEHQYVDPTPTNNVDMTVGILLSNPVEFRAVGWQPSAEEERDTSQIEKYLAGVLQINNDRQELHIPYELYLHFARDGCGILYSVWDNRIAQEAFTVASLPEGDPAGEPIQVPVYMEPPVTTEVIDPLQVKILPGGPKRWRCVIRTVRKTYADVEAEFGIRFDNIAAEQKVYTEGNLKDVWCWYHKEVPMTLPDGQPVINHVLGQPEVTKKWVVQQALMFEDKVIWPFRDMDGYNDLPFTIRFFKPVHRDSAEGWGHGVIDPLKDTLLLLERLTNRRTKQIDLYTALPVVTRTAAGKAISLDAVFGESVPLGLEDQISFLQWPGNPPDLEMHLSFLRARLQQAGFSDVMYAAGPSQVAGYALSQLTDQNRIRLEQPTKHLESLWSAWAKKVLDLTTHFASNAVVRVYGKLRGKDFAEQVVGEGMNKYMVQARVRTRFPNDDVRRMAMATQGRAMLSLYTLYQDYLNVEQPDDEYDRRLQEMAQNHPLMLQYGAMVALMELAKQGDQAAILTLANMGAIGGQPGRPPEPQHAEQLLGTQGPEGQPPPQAEGGTPPGQSPLDMLDQMATMAPRMMG